ncbi:pectate lyase, PelA/Pel-15E family [Alteromonadaceae bacterium Bs31]|nr:pectate lyase, PelA/Pel-15E family [Alteromonadaceae bacterium Bs31]
MPRSTPFSKFIFTALLLVSTSSLGATQATLDKQELTDTMKKATEFMVEKVSYKGGYVWSYLPDFSRRWGEMEAYETMIWVQKPGTASMGHLFLDAHHATGDEYYYRAAMKVAGALIKGQHKSGGWNYFIDFAGSKSEQRWYQTIGASGWRLEEFHHYYGNATFDDGATIEAAEFLLRLYLEKGDKKIKRALDKSIDFVLSSQYPIGGWPQRYPPAGEFSKQGLADYSKYITFNDDVAADNIHFLLFYYQTTGDTRVLDAIIRGMNAFLVTHIGPPQPGWAMQYSLDLQPAAARTYEPKALSASLTYDNVEQLLYFYELTGETKFLARIPETISWLKSLAVETAEGPRYPLAVELNTNRVLYVHRKGSDSTNGKYYVDYNPEKPLIHNRPLRELDINALEAKYRRVLEKPKSELLARSPLKSTKIVPLPDYFTLVFGRASDLNSRDKQQSSSSEENARRIMAELNSQHFWPTPLRATSNPYIGPGPQEPVPGDFSTTRVGDKYDTSPYYSENPTIGISTGVYIRNMGMLINALLEMEAQGKSMH